MRAFCFTAQLHVVQISINFFACEDRTKKNPLQTDITFTRGHRGIPAQVVVVDTFTVVVS